MAFDGTPTAGYLVSFAASGPASNQPEGCELPTCGSWEAYRELTVLGFYQVQ